MDGEGLASLGTTSGPMRRHLEAGLGFEVGWDKGVDFVGQQDAAEAFLRALYAPRSLWVRS